MKAVSVPPAKPWGLFDERHSVRPSRAARRRAPARRRPRAFGLDEIRPWVANVDFETGARLSTDQDAPA
jgi:hypothetical protein